MIIDLICELLHILFIMMKDQIDAQNRQAQYVRHNMYTYIQRIINCRTYSMGMTMCQDIHTNTCISLEQ